MNAEEWLFATSAGTLGSLLYPKNYHHGTIPHNLSTRPSWFSLTLPFKMHRLSDNSHLDAFSNSWETAALQTMDDFNKFRSYFIYVWTRTPLWATI